MIAYVNNFKDRTTISQFTANYDDSTGKLNGEMTLNMYYLENTGKSMFHRYFRICQKV